jgi:peptide/nickel transport system substrate-binding protein
MLEAVGFEIDLQQVTVTQIINSVYLEQNFELVPCFGVINPELLLYGSYRQFDSRNPANPVGYKNPALDAALDDLRAARTVEDYQAALEEMQEIWNTDVPTVPLFATRDGTAWRDGIRGVQWHNSFNPLLDRAWLED